MGTAPAGMRGGPAPAEGGTAPVRGGTALVGGGTALVGGVLLRGGRGTAPDFSRYSLMRELCIQQIHLLEYAHSIHIQIVFTINITKL